MDLEALHNQLAYLDLQRRTTTTNTDEDISPVNGNPTNLTLPNEIWLRIVETLSDRLEFQQNEAKAADKTNTPKWKQAAAATRQSLKSLSRTCRALRDFGQAALFKRVNFAECFDSHSFIKFGIISQPHLARHIRTLEVSVGMMCTKVAALHLPFDSVTSGGGKDDPQGQIFEEFLSMTAKQRIIMLLKMVAPTLRELRLFMRDQHVDCLDYRRRAEVESRFFNIIFEDCLKEIDFSCLKDVYILAPSNPKVLYDVTKGMKLPPRYIDGNNNNDSNSNTKQRTIFENNIARIKNLSVDVRLGFEGIGRLAKKLGRTTTTFTLTLGWSKWFPPATIPAIPAPFKAVHAAHSLSTITKLSLNRLEVIGSLSDIIPSCKRLTYIEFIEIQLDANEDDWCTLVSAILFLLKNNNNNGEGKKYNLETVKISHCGYRRRCLARCKNWKRRSTGGVIFTTEEGGVVIKDDSASNGVRALCTCREDDIVMFNTLREEVEKRLKERGYERAWNDPVPMVCVHDAEDGEGVGGW